MMDYFTRYGLEFNPFIKIPKKSLLIRLNIKNLCSALTILQKPKDLVF